MFTFAGLTHHKYTYYTSVMTADLELDSSPKFKEGFLKNWILRSASGGVAGNMKQEHINLSLDEGISRNNQTYNLPYVRDVLSPNLVQLSDHKRSMLATACLSPEKGSHTEASTDPGLRRLLTLFKDTEMHSYWSGRLYDVPGTEQDVNNYTKGMDWLRYEVTSGKLHKWIEESVYLCDIAKGAAPLNDEVVSRSNTTLSNTEDDIVSVHLLSDISTTGKADTHNGEEDLMRLEAGDVLVVEGQLVMESWLADDKAGVCTMETLENVPNSEDELDIDEDEVLRGYMDDDDA
jgi:hypothetical protein